MINTVFLKKPLLELILKEEYKTKRTEDCFLYVFEISVSLSLSIIIIIN